MPILESLNQAAFLAMNASPTTAEWKIALAAVVANYLIFLIPVFLVAVWCWGPEKQRSAALQSVAVTFLALGVNQIIGLIWFHPRPFAVGLGHTFIAHAADSSFPSDHATVFAAVGLTFILAKARTGLGWLLLGVGTVVACSRIYLGVHFPMDMVGAVLVAGGVALMVSPIWRRIGTPVTERVSAIYRMVLRRPIAMAIIRG